MLTAVFIGTDGTYIWNWLYACKKRRNVTVMSRAEASLENEGETHFPMTPETWLKNDNLAGMLELLT